MIKNEGHTRNKSRIGPQTSLELYEKSLASFMHTVAARNRLTFQWEYKFMYKIRTEEIFSSIF